MATRVVYDDVVEGASETLQGQLFAGKKFWVAQRVPSRNRYLESIRSNGGQIVMIEKKADYIIADHYRRDCPAGSLSYTFIEKSIERGEVVDPEDHRAGPQAGTSREVGSSSRPTKGTRAAYTLEEDRILYKWVQDHERQGGSASGNEIYKELEAQHPRHTWQSWRDRYLKQLKDRPPTGLAVPENAPPSPPSDQFAEKLPSERTARAEARRSASTQHEIKKERDTESLTVDDFDTLFNNEQWEELYANVSHILACTPQSYLEGWEDWAKTTSQTADQWRQYFEKVVKPQWVKDPAWKKESIKERVAKRHEDEQAQASQQAEITAREEDIGATGSHNASVKREPANEPPLGPGSKGEEDTVMNDASPKDKTASPSTPNRKRSAVFSPPVHANSFEELVDKFLEERKGRPAQEAYIFWAQKERQTVWVENTSSGYGGPFAARDIAHGTSTYYVKEIHRILTPRWNALSDEEKAPYVTMEAADKRRVEMEQVKEQALSSEPDTSTVAQETPQYISRTHQTIMKRIHDGAIDELTEEIESSRRVKRRRPNSSSPVTQNERPGFVGTQQQPLEISSGESSSSIQETSENQEHRQTEDINMEDVIQAELQTSSIEEDGLEEEENEEQPTPTIEVRSDFVEYPLLPTTDLNTYPADTPTPETPRQKQKTKVSAFDTQAIFSSPSQGYLLSALPRPTETQTSELRSRSVSLLVSSPAGKQESIASTTQSIQEFRRSTNEEDRLHQTFAPLPRPERGTSIAPSEVDSQASGDPDEPLRADELDDFFSEAHEEGFTDEEITAALKHTRMRPNLTEQVLHAWKDEMSLPNVRGIWSREDDEDVESGDGIALARLERKHTCDGWGGVTERLRFLQTYRGMS
jgi:hypothetical protein